MKKANFFIIGAPKCGTTSLYEYLIQHKQVFMSDPKEVHYLASDKKGLWAVQSDDAYNELFSNAKKEQKLIGEASVWYLYSKTAIEKIKNYNADAKLIIMLRKPHEMVYSMHSQQLFTFDEDINDFGKAWNESANRKNGKNIPKKCRVVENIYYDEIAKYAEQLERVYQHFDAKQVKVILFEDFVSNNETIFKETEEFLNLEHDDKIQFIHHNENKAHRNRVFGFLFNNSFFNRIGEKLNQLLGFKIGFLSFLKDKNTNITKRKKLDEELKNKIIENYRDDIQKLSQMLDRKLDSWWR